MTKTPTTDFLFPMAGAIALAFLAPGLAQDAAIEEAPMDLVQPQLGQPQALQPGPDQQLTTQADTLTPMLVDGVVTYVPSELVAEEPAPSIPMKWLTCSTRGSSSNKPTP